MAFNNMLNEIKKYINGNSIEYKNNEFIDTLINCTLVSTKKNSYYKFTSTDINNLLPNIFGVDYAKYNNCCNCICLVLYSMSNECSSPNGILKYISSITKTIINVDKYLPDYLVRIYLDPSIYKLLTNKMNETFEEQNCKMFINNLFNYKNVEIYTISCYNDSIPDHRTRVYRTLILKDPEVHIRIMRDADGIVSKMDCFNIKKFERSNKLFYLPSFSNIPIETIKTTQIQMYSPWLADYYHKTYNTSNSYHNKIPAYNLLCGMFATKIKFTENYYNDSVNHVKLIITPNYYFAFDEILLLELYKNILYFHLHSEKNIAIFNNIVYSHVNGITTFNTKLHISNQFQCKYDNGILNIYLERDFIEYINTKNKNFLESNDTDGGIYGITARSENINSFVYITIVSEILLYIDEKINYDDFNFYSDPINIKIKYDDLNKILLHLVNSFIEPNKRNDWYLNDLLAIPYGGTWKSLK